MTKHCAGAHLGSSRLRRLREDTEPASEMLAQAMQLTVCEPPAAHATALRRRYGEDSTPKQFDMIGRGRMFSKSAQLSLQHRTTGKALVVISPTIAARLLF